MFIYLFYFIHQDAAKYRDELKILAPHCLLICSSDATTLVSVLFFIHGFQFRKYYYGVLENHFSVGKFC
jgi:hypothetical protein